ncbi:eukaryotic translation initiation factor 5B-like [Impatiens glandulifera]|uniref:eukaryotic translation initiation factor 5B-like n=1 Tax=Impatiens glandulifera TaxID=253017 RepID=UPI001FB0E9F1|nr:eukaryotic translation initiation factor 5B-like [Impatiens glandulifera]
MGIRHPPWKNNAPPSHQHRSRCYSPIKQENKIQTIPVKEAAGPGSTSGRKKKSTAKAPAPVKDKSRSKKGKEPITFTEPPSQTRDEEESASTSDRTGSQKTDENTSDREGRSEEEDSGTSPNNTGATASLDADADVREEEEATPDNDQKIAATIVRNILEEIEQRVQAVAALYVAGTPKANLQLWVLDKLEIKKGELTEEIEQIDAVHRQREKPHSPARETDDGQNQVATPPLADPVINETEQLETDQHGVSEPGVTEERVKSLIQEFADSTVQPLQEKIKKAVRQTLLFAEKTRDDLIKAEDRITAIEDEYRADVVLHNEHYQQTEDLEEKTSRIVDDMDRFERETKQRFTEVDENLGRSSNKVDSTLDRVTDLEKKNASLEDRNDKLEADLKALTEQVAELLNAKINADTVIEEANARAAKEDQDALDEETRIAKETPRLIEEEIAERERNLAAQNPALAKSMAVQAAEDAERLNAQKQGL